MNLWRKCLLCFDWVHEENLELHHRVHVLNEQQQPQQETVSRNPQGQSQATAAGNPILALEQYTNNWQTPYNTVQHQQQTNLHNNVPNSQTCVSNPPTLLIPNQQQQFSNQMKPTQPLHHWPPVPPHQQVPATPIQHVAERAPQAKRPKLSSVHNGAPSSSGVTPPKIRRRRKIEKQTNAKPAMKCPNVTMQTHQSAPNTGHKSLDLFEYLKAGICPICAFAYNGRDGAPLLTLEHLQALHQEPYYDLFTGKLTKLGLILPSQLFADCWMAVNQPDAFQRTPICQECVGDFDFDEKSSVLPVFLSQDYQRRHLIHDHGGTLTIESMLDQCFPTMSSAQLLIFGIQKQETVGLKHHEPSVSTEPNRIDNQIHQKSTSERPILAPESTRRVESPVNPIRQPEHSVCGSNTIPLISPIRGGNTELLLSIDNDTKNRLISQAEPQSVDHTIYEQISPDWSINGSDVHPLVSADQKPADHSVPDQCFGQSINNQNFNRSNTESLLEIDNQSIKSDPFDSCSSHIEPNLSKETSTDRIRSINTNNHQSIIDKNQNQSIDIVQTISAQSTSHQSQNEDTVPYNQLTNQHPAKDSPTANHHPINFFDILDTNEPEALNQYLCQSDKSSAFSSPQETESTSFQPNLIESAPILERQTSVSSRQSSNDNGRLGPTEQLEPINQSIQIDQNQSIKTEIVMSPQKELTPRPIDCTMFESESSVAPPDPDALKSPFKASDVYDDGLDSDQNRSEIDSSTKCTAQIDTNQSRIKASGHTAQTHNRQAQHSKYSAEWRLCARYAMRTNANSNQRTFCSLMVDGESVAKDQMDYESVAQMKRIAWAEMQLSKLTFGSGD